MARDTYEIKGDGCEVVVDIRTEYAYGYAEIEANVTITEPGKSAYDAELESPSIYVQVRSRDDKPITVAHYQIIDRVDIVELVKREEDAVIKEEFGTYDAAAFTGELDGEQEDKELVEIYDVERDEEGTVVVDWRYFLKD